MPLCKHFRGAEGSTDVCRGIVVQQVRRPALPPITWKTRPVHNPTAEQSSCAPPQFRYAEADVRKPLKLYYFNDSVARSFNALLNLSPERLAPALKHRWQIAEGRLWIWPLVGVVGLIAAGCYGYSFVRDVFVEREKEAMRSVAENLASSLHFWMDEQAATAQAVSSESFVRRQTANLLQVNASLQNGSSPEATASSKAALALREILMPICRVRSFNGYVVLDLDGQIVAASEVELVETNQLGVKLSSILNDVRTGATVVTPPFPSVAALPDDHGLRRQGQPTMFAMAPLRNDQGKIEGILGLRINPSSSFDRLFRMNPLRETSEVYAFDRSGQLLSRSRFVEVLKGKGLVSNEPHADGTFAVERREPSGNRPMTRLATAALTGSDGVEFDSYHNFRGVEVVGAWDWIESLDMGVAVEVDAREVNRPLLAMRYTSLGLLGLLLGSAAMIGAVARSAVRSPAGTSVALSDSAQYGQYTLEEKIGEGGMGTVYRATHAVMPRPTAVKLMNLEKNGTDPLAIARFMSEAEVTSQLSHPNTVTIFDHGKGPRGQVYYAMEYLDGLNLAELILRFGPQPPGRVIQILRQICGALAEAHGKGIIHRDIKPENLMLLDQGGWSDFVKVLDFGLATWEECLTDAPIPPTKLLNGTPKYIAPERVQDPDGVDGRSDLYSLGAVGYFLLTGKHAFTGRNPAEIYSQQLHQQPLPPSRQVTSPIDAALDALILQCLEKDVQHRPESARKLAVALAVCEKNHPWSSEDAEQWWEYYRDLMSPTQTIALSEESAACQLSWS